MLSHIEQTKPHPKIWSLKFDAEHGIIQNKSNHFSIVDSKTSFHDSSVDASCKMPVIFLFLDVNCSL